jgi:hypothetical protein
VNHIQLARETVAAKARASRERVSRNLSRSVAQKFPAVFCRTGSAHPAELPCEVLLRFAAACHDGEIVPYAFDQSLDGHLPWLSGDAMGTRVLCMKTIFQMPPCLRRKADSNHFWLVVPETSVMLPLLT